MRHDVRKKLHPEKRGQGAYRGEDSGLPKPPSRKASRPGLAQPFIVPMRLRDQNNRSEAPSDVKFNPQGKTLVGGQQWAFDVSRPGLARPLIAPRAADAPAASAPGKRVRRAAKMEKKPEGKAKGLKGWLF